jgi:hypothetical protein
MTMMVRMVIIANLRSAVEFNYFAQKFVTNKHYHAKEPTQVVNLHPYVIRHAQTHIHLSFLHLSYCLHFQHDYLLKVNDDAREN